MKSMMRLTNSTNSKMLAIGLLFSLFSLGGTASSSQEAPISQASEDANYYAQLMYVAYYGRPGDPGGVAYWTERMLSECEGCYWSDELINAFGTSDEYIERFGNLETEDLINNLYDQMFNRDAEPGGLTFYIDLMDAGDSTLSEIALDVALGAQNEDLKCIENKVDAASYFTEKVETERCNYGPQDIDPVASILSSVDETDASLIVAEGAFDQYVDNMWCEGEFCDLVIVETSIFPNLYEGSYFCQEAYDECIFETVVKNTGNERSPSSTVTVFRQNESAGPFVVGTETVMGADPGQEWVVWLEFTLPHLVAGPHYFFACVEHVEGEIDQYGVSNCSPTWEHYIYIY